MSNTTLAERPKNDLRVMIQSEQIQSQLALALPRYYTAEQFTLIVRTEINRNPKLAECEPTSFLTSILTAAQMGLAVNRREAHLIPRWNSKTSRLECTFLPDYKGIVKLVRLNDNVADVYAVCVHKNDAFRITQGLHRDIIHEPDYTQDRGQLIGVYAVILYKSGLATWEFMSRSEVEPIRERSESWKSHVSKGYDSPWKTDEGEMFKKTALKRVSKLADISPDSLDRLNADNDLEYVKEVKAKEIKQATIPDRPQQEVQALPAPPLTGGEGIPSAQTAPEVETKAAQSTGAVAVKPAVPAEKAAKAKVLEKKPAAKKEPEPEPEGEALSKIAAKGKKMVEDAGHTVADFIRAAQANDWLAKEFDPDTTSIAAFGDENLVEYTSDQNWQTVVDEMKLIVDAAK